MVYTFNPDTQEVNKSELEASLKLHSEFHAKAT